MTQDPLDLAVCHANKVLKNNIPELTFEEKLKANNEELIKAMCTSLSTATLTREGLSHALLIMDITQKLCKENGNSQKINAKRYKYLLNKIQEFDNYFIPLIKTLERTVGVEGLERGFEEQEAVTDVYSQIYDQFEVEVKEEE